MKPFFSRLGGKTKFCKKIVGMIPNHKIYVEAFIGAGSVFLKKDRGSIEVINDLDKDIYDIWNDVRQVNQLDLIKMNMKADKDRFLEMKLYPERFSDTHQNRFYRNMYLSKNSFCSNRRTYGTYYENHPNNIKTLVENLGQYQTRLNGVVVENKDYKEVINIYDSPDTFFYLDPPYSNPIKEWNYVSSILPTDLLKVLRSIKGKFIMSYDDTPQNRELFKEFKITIIPIVYRFKKNVKHTSELLIQNF